MGGMENSRFVLLVESNATLAIIYSQMLQSFPGYSYQVHVSSTVDDALQIVASRAPDAIVLDTDIENEQNMASLFELYSYGQKTPIVSIVSEDVFSSLHLLELGIQDYLPKDLVSANALITTVGKSIIRKRREVELQRDNSHLREEGVELKEALEKLETAHKELQNMQTRLVDAEKSESIARLTAGVAHEVKNPLQIILSATDYLKIKAKKLEDSTMNTVIEQMREAVSRANSIILEMLDFSRPRELEATVQDLNPILERNLLLMKGEFNKFGIRIHKNLDEHLPQLRLNKNKISQVLVNLIINAIHAMEKEGGDLIVTSKVAQVERSDPSSFFEEVNEGGGSTAVVVTIKDTGSGIPEEILSKIFDPFFTTKPEGKGTGLGMTVARKIITLHGGDMMIANDPAGGAVVTIVFTDFYPDLSIGDIYSDDDLTENNELMTFE